jgi:hypothetical protein
MLGAVFPPEAGLLDVRKFGATGSGTRDDTAAIEAAIAAGQKQKRAIYFPNGTYLISSTLRSSDDAAVVWEGQSREKTVLRLKDACAGFTNTQKPQPIIEIAGRPRNGYGHAICDLTIDAGKGNPGAIGVQIAALGQACVRSVTIRSGDGRGKVGLDLTRGPLIGPVLAKDVRIIGFDFGARSAFAGNNVTFEEIALEGQARAGFANEGQCVAIRRMHSRNNGPAIINAKGPGPGILLLLDCNFQGLRGAASRPAVENESALFARDVASATYRETIHNVANSNRPGNARKVAEFASQPVVDQSSNAGKSLAMPVKPTPDVPWDGPESWAAPTRFGAVPDDDVDDSQPIQAAMDSGKPSLVFPPGRYVLRSTVLIRGTVRRILGLSATIDHRGLAADAAAFKIVDGSAPVVVFERLEALDAAAPLLVNDSRRTLIAKDGRGFSGRFTGTGELYLENVSTNRRIGWKFDGPNVWARSLIAEECARGIAVAGGSAWCLGFRATGSGPFVDVTAGGRVEILGGVVKRIAGERNAVMFTATDASLSVIAQDATTPATQSDVLIRETRAGETHDLRRRELSGQARPDVLMLSAGPPER